MSVLDIEKTVKLSSKDKFILKYKDATINEINAESVYWQQKNFQKLEAIRSNTSKIVWFIFIGILLGILSVALNL